jgi:hypothetical protein
MRLALLLLLVAVAANAAPAQPSVSSAPQHTQLAVDPGAGERIVATVE